MTALVTIHDDAEARVVELQAEIQLRTDKTITPQELLTRPIDEVYESRETVVDSFR